ncbi:unnamed protein product [Closterium sp. NIES-54]
MPLSLVVILTLSTISFTPHPPPPPFPPTFPPRFPPIPPHPPLSLTPGRNTGNGNGLHALQIKIAMRGGRWVALVGSALGFSGVLWGALGCSGVLWGALGCSGVVKEGGWVLWMGFGNCQ